MLAVGVRDFLHHNLTKYWKAISIDALGSEIRRPEADASRPSYDDSWRGRLRHLSDVIGGVTDALRLATAKGTLKTLERVKGIEPSYSAWKACCGWSLARPIRTAAP